VGAIPTPWHSSLGAGNNPVVECRWRIIATGRING
jgi:hypothetical protein